MNTTGWCLARDLCHVVATAMNYFLITTGQYMSEPDKPSQSPGPCVFAIRAIDAHFTEVLLPQEGSKCCQQNEALRDSSCLVTRSCGDWFRCHDLGSDVGRASRSLVRFTCR